MARARAQTTAVGVGRHRRIALYHPATASSRRTAIISTGNRSPHPAQTRGSHRASLEISALLERGIPSAGLRTGNGINQNTAVRILRSISTIPQSQSPRAPSVEDAERSQRSAALDHWTHPDRDTNSEGSSDGRACVSPSRRMRPTASTQVPARRSDAPGENAHCRESFERSAPGTCSTPPSPLQEGQQFCERGG